MHTREDLLNDPDREERLELFEAYIKKVFRLCKKHLGKSKYQDSYPTLILNKDTDDIMGGYFCHDLNELEINYQGFDKSKYCAEYYAQLVYHEMIHYHQSPIWFKRYYTMGHDYLTHPYEVEAYKRESEILNLI